MQKHSPYGGLGLGVGVIGVNENTATKFAWDAKAGCQNKNIFCCFLKTGGLYAIHYFNIWK